MVTQDLPPPSGFGTIKIERNLPKPLVRHGTLLGVAIAITINGLFLAKEWHKRYRVLRIEQTEHYIATVPFIMAEQERKYLLQLNKIREDEREIMKDVPGWKVGTLFGEPVYKTLPKNTLTPVSPMEFGPKTTYSQWLFEVIFPDFWE